VELGWKTLQDLLAAKGYDNIKGPKPAVKQAFQDGYITDGNGWIVMLDSRNETVHVYDDEIAKTIAEEIIHNFHPLFNDLEHRLLLEKDK
jgi:nucleotidyltransferase substrate binding protein (TIGR01987 family)